MKVKNCRVHIAGSASVSCDEELLRKAHSFVRGIARKIAGDGGGIVMGIGKDPIGEFGLPCTFDWTVVSEITGFDVSIGDWPELRGGRFVTVASQSALEKIPSEHLATWAVHRKRTDVTIAASPPGWRMAGIVRARQVEHGDVLLLLGGGAGVEHLAEMYMDSGKPVIPISADVGSLNVDGNGGSQYLHKLCLTNPNSFFRLQIGKGDASARLMGLKLDKDTDVDLLVLETMNLLSDLRDPAAFYVRLLDDGHDDIETVEGFFRDVVDPVVVGHGFRPDQMGDRTPEVAFMNVDIFRSIRLAGLVVVDLTGVRPNCMMELGFALGLKKRVVLTAMEGTMLPFDPDHIPTYFWNPAVEADVNIVGFENHFDTFVDLPPVD